MTTQRTTNLHSAPMSACLRAFVLAGQSGMALSSRPYSHVRSSIGGCSNAAMVGNTARFGGMAGNLDSSVFKRGNGNDTRYNSVQLRGSA
jgi:hypothetical protein